MRKGFGKYIPIFGGIPNSLKCFPDSKAQKSRLLTQNFPHSGKRIPLGADHLTLDGGVGDFWSARIFFPSNLVGRIFVSLLNALQDIFSLLISLQDFFSSKKGHVFTYTKCIYTYIVVIAVIVLIWSCKALKCCKLYKIIIV